MTPEKLGSLVGAVFGLVFVVVNAGTLPTVIGTVLRALAVVAFLVVLDALRRPRRPRRTVASAAGRPGGGGFGTGYWLVVAAEVVSIAVGVRVLGGPLDTPDARVAWVAFVVGVHFVALAVVWAESVFHWLGGSMAACGVLGLTLAFAGAPHAAVASIGGVLPGALLLAFAVWGATVGTDSRRSRADATVGGAE
jgi:hypothetical protein